MCSVCVGVVCVVCLCMCLCVCARMQSNVWFRCGCWSIKPEVPGKEFGCHPPGLVFALLNLLQTISDDGATSLQANYPNCICSRTCTNQCCVFFKSTTFRILHCVSGLDGLPWISPSRPLCTVCCRVKLPPPQPHTICCWGVWPQEIMWIPVFSRVIGEGCFSLTGWSTDKTLNLFEVVLRKQGSDLFFLWGGTRWAWKHEELSDLKLPDKRGTTARTDNHTTALVFSRTRTETKGKKKKTNGMSPQHNSFQLEVRRTRKVRRLSNVASFIGNPGLLQSL